MPTYGPRVTVNLTRRVAVESDVSFIQIYRDDFASLVTGTYSGQFKYVVRPGGPSRAQVFVVAGMIGEFDSRHVNRSPSRDYFHVSVPYFPTVGVGVTIPIGRYGRE